MFDDEKPVDPSPLAPVISIFLIDFVFLDDPNGRSDHIARAERRTAAFTFSPADVANSN